MLERCLTHTKKKRQANNIPLKTVSREKAANVQKNIFSKGLQKEIFLKTTLITTIPV